MGASGIIMAELFKFFIDYKPEGSPVGYKVDEITDVSIEKDKDVRFIQNLKFNMHEATEEELEEYNSSNK
jgi:hypothetical protein